MSKQKSLEQLNQEVSKGNINTKILTYSLSPIWIPETIYLISKVKKLPGPTDETEGTIKTISQSKNNKQLKILVIGESTVSGDGLKSFKETIGHQFIQLLSKKKEFQDYDIHWKLIGESGFTIKQLSNKYLSQINGKDYDIVILQDCTNDAVTFTNVQEFKQSTKDFITKLLKDNPFLDIYLPSPADISIFPIPNPLKYILTKRQQLIQKCLYIVAKEINNNLQFQGQVIANNELELVADLKFFGEDKFHPSAYGAAVLAKKIFDDVNPKLPQKFISQEQKQNL